MFQQSLVQAIQRGDSLHTDFWDDNPGIIEMRKIMRETAPNTGGRMARAQQAFPYIKAMWERLDKAIKFLPVPKDLKSSIHNLGRLFARARNDPEYAKLLYNNFPILADRYGDGKQANGKPRLSFIKMINDPLCQRLTQASSICSSFTGSTSDKVGH